jgi:hypothetical protein
MKKKFKNPFKQFVIFLRVSLSILLNIWLYFYNVRYKSSIKILGFLRNISKKKELKQISKKKFKTLKLFSLFTKQKRNKTYFVFMHTTKS